jgi:hypothetical protein
MSNLAATASKPADAPSQTLVSPRRTRSVSAARALDVSASSKSSTQLSHNIAISTKPSAPSPLLHTQAVSLPALPQHPPSTDNLSTIASLSDDAELSLHSPAHSSSHSSTDLSRSHSESALNSNLLYPIMASAADKLQLSDKGNAALQEAVDLKGEPTEGKYADQQHDNDGLLHTIAKLRSDLAYTEERRQRDTERYAIDLDRRLLERDRQHAQEVRDILKEQSKSTIASPPTHEVDKTRTISDTIIGPKQWTGKSTDDPELWLDYFHQYCTFRNLEGADKLRLFTILMRDGASVWLQTLPQQTTRSYDNLIAAFKEYYFSSPELKFQEASALWSCPQKPTESVNDYVTRLRRGANRLNINDETLHYAILNGLRAPIKSHVLTQGVKKIQDTIHAARIAEATISTDPISALLTETIKATLDASERQANRIKELTSKVGALSVTALTPPADAQAAAREADDRPRPSQPPRDYRPKFATNQRSRPQTTDYAQPRAYQPRFVKQTPQNLQRANYGRNQAAQGAQRSADNHQNRQPYEQQTHCGNCGGFAHPRDECPAQHQHCSLCGKLHHWAKVCRSAGRRN